MHAQPHYNPVALNSLWAWAVHYLLSYKVLKGLGALTKHAAVPDFEIL